MRGIPTQGGISCIVEKQGKDSGVCSTGTAWDPVVGFVNVKFFEKVPYTQGRP